MLLCTLVYTRVGFSGECSPRHIIPSNFSLSKQSPSIQYNINHSNHIKHSQQTWQTILTVTKHTNKTATVTMEINFENENHDNDVHTYANIVCFAAFIGTAVCMLLPFSSLQYAFWSFGFVTQLLCRTVEYFYFWWDDEDGVNKCVPDKKLGYSTYASNVVLYYDDFIPCYI